MRKNYLKITIALGFIALLFSACTDNGNKIDNPIKPFTINKNITSNTTWESGKIYVLGSRISVESGAVLTIEPGTVIKGEAGSGANATALVIAKGGKLMAKGTAAKPIIFTSIADEIKPGEITNNLDPELDALWGGLIVLGDAPISADDKSIQIEGIPASDPTGLYGGLKSDDNSGTIQYVSVRHGGSNIGEGNEINGITLGGVGTGTIIDHIEIVANQDDGIECFGGTVNVSHILVWNQGDDAFDMDQDYTGTIDNFIGIAGESSDHALELDGPEGAKDDGGFTLKNGSFKGWNDDGEDGGEYADLRDGVKCTLTNLYFFNFSDDSDFEIDEDDGFDNYKNGDILIEGLEFNVSHLTEGNTTIDKIMLDKSDKGGSFDELTDDKAKVVISASVGADKSEFACWTWADDNGELSDF